MNDNDSNQQRDGQRNNKNHPPMAELMLIRAMQQQQKADEVNKSNAAANQKKSPPVKRISTKGDAGFLDRFSAHEGVADDSKIIQMLLYCDVNQTCYQEQDIYQQYPFFRTTFHTQSSPELLKKNPYPTGAIISIYNQHEIMFQMGRRYVVTMETEEEFFARMELVRRLKSSQQFENQSDNNNSAMGMDDDGSADQQQQQQPGE